MSPTARAATTRHAPPATCCIPVPSSWFRGSGPCRAYSEPAAQAMEAKTSIPIPHGSRRATPSAGRSRMATPSNPTSRPTDRQQARATPRDHGVEQVHPDRNGGDQHGRDPRRHRALRGHHHPVATEQQQAPDDQRGPPLDQPRRVDARGAAAAAPSVLGIQEREQDAARDEEARRGCQERRHGLDDIRDGEVGGAPDGVDGDQRHRDGQRRRGWATRGHWCIVPHQGETEPACRFPRGRFVDDNGRHCLRCRQVWRMSR